MYKGSKIGSEVQAVFHFREGYGGYVMGGWQKQNI